MKFVKGYSKEGTVFRGEAKLPRASPKQSKLKDINIPKTKELSPSKKKKLEKDIKIAMKESYDVAYKDYMKREAEKGKSEMKSIKNQAQKSGHGWHDESQRHAQARMGIKTSDNNIPIVQEPVMQDIRDTTTETGQTKLSNNIQDDMHKLDKLLRRASNISDKKKVNQSLLEAEKIYWRLGDKVKHHRSTVGELPQWVGKTWQGQEDFGKNGAVKKKIDQLLNADDDNFEKKQKELFNSVRLPTEQVRG